MGKTVSIPTEKIKRMMTPEEQKNFDEAVRGTMKLPMKEQDPRDIVGRCLTLERMRTIPVELIEKLSPKFDKFLIGKTSKSLDKNGNPLTKAKINFEYALFDATQREILDLFSNFTKVKKGDKQEE